MHCLLLALGLALLGGTQAIFVPQDIKDLDVQKAWEQGRSVSQTVEDLDIQKAREQGLFVPQNVEDLDVQKVAGTWYSMAMAASDTALLDTEDAPLRVYIKELRPTPQNNLEIILHRREDGSCAERRILAEKTEVPAEFKITYLDQNKVHVVDTDYDKYLILCMENADVPGQSLGCQYLARTPKADVGALEQFNRALKLLPTRIWLLLTPTQAEERCRV